MEDKKLTSAQPETPAEQLPKEEAKKKEDLVPGGLFVSTVLFLLFGVVFFVQSVQMFMDDPRPQGHGTFPMIVSGLLIVLTIIDFIQKTQIKSSIAGLSFKEKFIAIIKFLFPINSFVFLLMSIAFYVAIELGVPFLVAAPVFLMASMCYLIPHNIVKNLIYTAVIIGAIYAIFALLFKVTLP